MRRQFETTPRPSIVHLNLVFWSKSLAVAPIASSISFKTEQLPDSVNSLDLLGSCGTHAMNRILVVPKRRGA